MKVRVAFGEKGALLAAERGHIVIVVDTLRASTTVTTALENGAERVIPVRTVKNAKKLFQSLVSKHPREKVVLAGERRGLRIPGFDLGNSPLEFTRSVVEGKIVILTTTNFTKVVSSALKAPFIMAGCLRNAMAAASLAMREAAKQGRNVTIVHSGRKGFFTPEDYITAVVIKNFMEGRREPEGFERCVFNSPSAKYLASIGLGEDVKYCAQLNQSKTVPVIEFTSFVGRLISPF
ncbi:MAG: 2-phosphosulfolactate phosphatase [Candidatus Freyarchaeota archaeon]|nr:2-phosphosulfolactate phosphatase [Candidatus Freyrarchaeum guaymaensis]